MVQCWQRADTVVSGDPQCHLGRGELSFNRILGTMAVVFLCAVAASGSPVTTASCQSSSTPSNTEPAWAQPDAPNSLAVAGAARDGARECTAAMPLSATLASDSPLLRSLSAPMSASRFAAAGRGEALAGIPSAIILTLVGFICVTLVRDGRTWAFVAARLCRFTQAGVLRLPRLAAGIIAGRGIRLAFCARLVPETRRQCRTVARLETAFAGLLRRATANGPDAALATIECFGRHVISNAVGPRHAREAAFAFCSAGSRGIARRVSA